MEQLLNNGKLLLLSFVALLAPIHSILITAFALVVVDMITGIWAALKSGQKISSAKLRHTVSKLLIYQIAIITAWLVETYMHLDFIPAVKLVSAMIGLVELKSVIENCNIISGQNIFKMLIEKLGSANLED